MGRALQTVALCGAVLGLATAVLARYEAWKLLTNVSGDESPRSVDHTVNLSPPLLARFSPRVAHMLSLEFWRPASYWLNFRLVDFLTFDRQDDFSKEGLEGLRGTQGRKRSLQAMAAVQPSIESIYLLACYQLALAEDDPGSCQKISQDGMAAFPNSFRIAMMQGYVAGVLQDNDAEAVRWFALAKNIVGSPPLAAKMAKLYASNTEWDATTFSESIAFFDDLPGGTGFKEMLQDEAQESASRGGDSSGAGDGENPPATLNETDESGPNEEPSDGAQ